MKRTSYFQGDFLIGMAAFFSAAWLSAAEGDPATTAPTAVALKAHSQSSDEYRAAAKAGNLDALVQLGYCYEFGQGGEAVDLPIAARCFAEAGRFGVGARNV